MSKKNTPAKINHLHCLNCGYPFFRNEVYCPECGQKNKNNKITFNSFINEVFKGFTSWDAKFWKTLLPLITKPGKVSKDYIEGKRTRYTNPFRFYLTTSVIFFLLVGLGNAIESYQEFLGENQKSLNNDLEILTGNENSTSVKDSLNTKNDTITIKHAQVFKKDITKFVSFQRKHPNLPAHQALDSLKQPKTFFNKFLYKKSETINGFSKRPDKSINTLINQATSHLSTAIFILLPLFALFLKLLYFRQKYTYVEHLVFVFHTQTVFFILLIFFSLLAFFLPKTNSGTSINIFILLFLAYLFIAMKVFYKQKYLKTIIKFLITITAYTFIAILGTGVVMIIAFTLM